MGPALKKGAYVMGLIFMLMCKTWIPQKYPTHGTVLVHDSTLHAVDHTSALQPRACN